MRGYLIMCAVLACYICIVKSEEKVKRQVNNGPTFFCYYATWAKYTRMGASAIDPFLCTHILVAFAEVQLTTQTAGIIAFDRSDENDVFPQMLGLKARNPSLKVLLAVGGWSHGTARFTKVADNPTLLNSFVQNTVSYLKKFGFDGLDVDWEFPTSKPQFTRFIRAIRNEFNKVENSYLELTSAMSAGEATIISGYDIPTLAPLLDYVLLMSYDLHGGWEGKTGHNSPLFPRAEESTWRARLNTEWAAKEWNSRGVARSKIVIGMTTYARRFTLRDRNVNGVEAPAAWWNQILTYTEVCSEFLPGSTVVWDRDSQAHYAIKGDLWLSFDSVESLRVKTEWTVLNGFGGAMVWTLDQDDYSNRCSQGAYPLLTTIRRGLFGSDGGASIPPFPGSLSTVTAPTGTPPTTRPTTTRSTTPRIITPGSVDCARDPSGDYPIIGVCTAFIKCSNGVESIFQCPPTLFYDPTFNWCNFEVSVKPNRPDCLWVGSGATTTTRRPITLLPITQVPPITQRTTTTRRTTTRRIFFTRRTTPRTTTTTSLTTTAAGQVDCKAVSTGNYVFKGDCTRFFQCVSGFRFVNTCPGGLLYDVISNSCDWAYIVKQKRSDCP